MKCTITCILSKDEIFARKLAHYLSRSSRNGMIVRIFTDYDWLKRSGIHDIDAVIVDVVEEGNDSLHKSDLANYTNTHCRWIYLTDFMSGVNRITEYEWKVSRYTSCREILGILEDRMFLQEGRENYSTSVLSGNLQGKQVLGIYSPVGRCGKTSMAICLTRLLSQNGRAVILSMDGYNSWFAEADNHLVGLVYDVSRYEAFMGKGGAIQADYGGYQVLDFESGDPGEKALELIEKYVKEKSGIHYIPVSEKGSEILEITGKQLSMVIQVLMYKYDYVVVDFAQAAFHPRELVDKCKIMFIPSAADLLSVDKIQNFLKEAEEWDLGKKLKEVILPSLIRTDSLDKLYEELAFSSFEKAVAEILDRIF